MKRMMRRFFSGSNSNSGSEITYTFFIGTIDGTDPTAFK